MATKCKVIAVPVALAGAQSKFDQETVEKILNDQLAEIEAVGTIKNQVKLTESRIAVFYEESTS